MRAGTANEEISPLLLFYQRAPRRYSLAGSRQDPPVPLTSEHGRSGAESLTDVLALAGVRSRSSSFLSFLARAPRQNPRAVFALGFSEQVLKCPALRASLNRAAIARRRRDDAGATHRREKGGTSRLVLITTNVRGVITFRHRPRATR